MIQSDAARGVCFLANNRVFDQTHAFPRSFRNYKPDLPLCLIPYNDECDRVYALMDVSYFSTFENVELLKNCDEISTAFHGWALAAYRKLVTWKGKFDSFIYIDVDTVVVDAVNFAFSHLKYSRYVASHYISPHVRHWLWKDSIHETDLLTPPQIAYSANTGFLPSSRNLPPMALPCQLNGTLLLLRDRMELFCSGVFRALGNTYGRVTTIKSAGLSVESCGNTIGTPKWRSGASSDMRNGFLLV